jgi:hypothetical protein
MPWGSTGCQQIMNGQRGGAFCGGVVVAQCAACGQWCCAEHLEGHLWNSHSIELDGSLKEEF